MTLTLVSWSPVSSDGDPDLFLLAAATEHMCLSSGYGDRIIHQASLLPGAYYIVVDGWMGWQGDYVLDVAWQPVDEMRRLFLPIIHQ